MTYVIQEYFWIPYVLMSILGTSLGGLFAYRFIRSLVMFWRQRLADHSKWLSLGIIAAYGTIAAILLLMVYSLSIKEGVMSVEVNDAVGVTLRYRWTEERFTWDQINAATLSTRKESRLGIPLSPRKWRKYVELDTVSGTRVIEAGGVNIDIVMNNLFNHISDCKKKLLLMH